MTESVQTGGLVKFDYSNGNSGKLDEERKRAIEEGYAAADERERKDKRKKMIYWIILVLFLILITGYFILKR